MPTDELWVSETEYVPITASAAYVLRRVTGDEYVWIDSVCVNQGDNKEKSIQLRYMWGIYKKKSWLGLEAHKRMATLPWTCSLIFLMQI